MKLPPWQDVAFTAGNALLSFGLLPAIFSSHKPPLSTALIGVVGMTVIGVANASLKFYLASVVVALTTLAWAVLALQALAGR